MSKKIFIVAEIGNNHEGNFQLAKKLIYEAYRCGVDAVKFQVFKTDLFIHNQDKKSYKKFKKFELSQKKFLLLKRYSEKLGLTFFGSAFDNESLDFLIRNTNIIKVASSENVNLEMINKILKNGKKCIISTGFLNTNLIKKLINNLNKSFSKNFLRKKLSLMHCISSYPVNNKDLNLNVIKELKKNFNLNIGYSDHSLGSDACKIAVSLGAKIIEKHFTLDKNFSNFRDHKLSADPKEMREIVNYIKDIELILGNGKKKITENEQKNFNSCRRSFYLKKSVKKGEKIIMEDLMALRPYVKNSLKIENKKKLINKKYNKNFKKNSALLI